MQPSAEGRPAPAPDPGADAQAPAAETNEAPGGTTATTTGTTTIQRARRRQRRVPGGRHRPVHVRVSDDEHVRLSARAAAAGLSLPAWLVAAGMADRGGSGRDGGAGGRSLAGGSMSALERRAWAAEFVAVRRLARGVATNVNQLAAGYNATGEVGTELHAVLDAARRVMDRMDDLGARLAGEGEGDDALDKSAAATAHDGARA
jgi:hypothetical protein